MALLCMTSAVSAGCAGVSRSSVLPGTERVRIYAAVLREMRRDTAARRVVVDSLVPTTDLDAELRQMVMTDLAIDKRTLDSFLLVQRAPRDRFVPGMLPDAGWMMVSMPQLDSLRAVARAAIANGSVARTARNDAFWQQWYRAYPASGGYVMLSPASVSADGAAAMVHVRIACGPLCGETELRLLRRDAAGAWHTISRVRLSES